MRVCVSIESIHVLHDMVNLWLLNPVWCVGMM